MTNIKWLQREVSCYDNSVPSMWQLVYSMNKTDGFLILWHLDTEEVQLQNTTQTLKI